MASLGGVFDISFANIGSGGGTSSFSPSPAILHGDDYLQCGRCGYGGCDGKVMDCGCTFHARCFPLNPNGTMVICPICQKPTTGISLLPMSFHEIDEAQKSAMVAPMKGRNRKRKSVSGLDGFSMEERGVYVSERRTGRWTSEELTYCDKLMEKFGAGELPVSDGTKLNEFLGNMLKSKQSRLTKKMKNAKLSAKTFQRTTGCIELSEVREFSNLEEAFFQSVQDPQERAEIKFHMKKEWREQFSRVCTAIGQPLDADAWLSSVEEMDRRESRAKDSARMAKRKRMMGVALRTDSQNTERGVFIEATEAEARAMDVMDQGASDKDVEEEMLSILAEDATSIVPSTVDVEGKSGMMHSAPFLTKSIAYLERHGVPFEHIDLWVPSFVSGNGENGEAACRLCYAGSSSVEKLVSEDGKETRALTGDEQFNLQAFGDYSQKFSFEVGCGLPGRVYESGRPTWEQGVHNAPHHHFERCGGAHQWGIKTVVGIPIASPNVGRIVVTMYSIFDREKNEELVVRLSEEFTRLMPSPKWKLVVDIGNVGETLPLPVSTLSSSASAPVADSDDDRKESAELSVTQSTPADSLASLPSALSSQGKDSRIDEVIALLGEYMPSDPSSPMSTYLGGFMSLRLLLLRPSRSDQENEHVRTMLDSYTSYAAGGRQRADIAVMLARDFMYLSQQQQSESFPAVFGMGQGVSQGNSNPSLSLFGLPSTSSSPQNSPALAPIPVPGNIDSLSIVSN